MGDLPASYQSGLDMQSLSCVIKFHPPSSDLVSAKFLGTISDSPYQSRIESYLPELLARLERQHKGLVPALIVGALLLLIFSAAGRSIA